MKIVGLTGGIGSGKTTVAGMFRDLGVPVYNSDTRAKELMSTSPELREKIVGLLGEDAYVKGELNRAFIAEQVFMNKELLAALNAIVHPAVREDFTSWASSQQASYVIQEAAILFENGAYTGFDSMILVTAPRKIRLERIMQRDSTSESDVLARMSHQWADEKKVPLAQFVIENIELENTRSAVGKIHKKLSE